MIGFLLGCGGPVGRERADIIVAVGGCNSEVRQKKMGEKRKRIKRKKKKRKEKKEKEEEGVQAGGGAGEEEEDEERNGGREGGWRCRWRWVLQVERRMMVRDRR